MQKTPRKQIRFKLSKQYDDQEQSLQVGNNMVSVTSQRINQTKDQEIEQKINGARAAAHMSVKNMSFSYRGGRKIFENINLDIPKGKITTLIGPNGCGKSTLLGILTREHRVSAGEILLEEIRTETIKRRIFSQKVAVLHQHNSEEVSVTVRELVSYGRSPYEGLNQAADTQGEKIIDWALEAVGLDKMSDKPIDKLSGGQRQRAWLAMCLCQKPEILFLDEPTTYLDIYYQLELLALVKKLNRVYGMTIVMVLHDINQALNYSDHIIMMKEGKIIKAGMPAEIAEGELLENVYQVESKIYHHQDERYLVDFFESNIEHIKC